MIIIKRTWGAGCRYDYMKSLEKKENEHNGGSNADSRIINTKEEDADEDSNVQSNGDDGKKKKI